MATSITLTQVRTGHWYAGASTGSQGTGTSGRIDLSGGPPSGAVVRVKVQKISGAATEVAPSVTTTTTGATTDVVMQATPVADRTGWETDTLIDEAGKAAYQSPTPLTPMLYLWFGLDAGADNVVAWEIYIDEDWS